MEGGWRGLRGSCGELAGRGCGDRSVGRLRLHRDWELGLGLCHLRLRGELQRGWQGRGREAGRGQPGGQLRRRRVQAGGVLHRGPGGGVVLLLALLLAGELSGLRGRRHSSCKKGQTQQP